MVAHLCLKNYITQKNTVKVLLFICHIIISFFNGFISFCNNCTSLNLFSSYINFSNNKFHEANMIQQFETSTGPMKARFFFLGKSRNILSNTKADLM